MLSAHGDIVSAVMEDKSKAADIVVNVRPGDVDSCLALVSGKTYHGHPIEIQVRVARFFSLQRTKTRKVRLSSAYLAKRDNIFFTQKVQFCLPTAPPKLFAPEGSFLKEWLGVNFAKA
jgi:hypothetical protein